MTFRRPARVSQQGATLVELVMTIVIISIAIAGVVGAFALIIGRSAEPLNQTRAVALSQLYMDEILSKSFAHGSPVGGGAVDADDADCSNPGPDGETRRTFNDVDDYHNPTNAPPENSEQESLPGYNNFQVSISVACAGTEVGLSNHEAKRIDITVTDPSGNTYLFSAYRGNF
ncbi:MAG: MSHA pilin protein MshD [Marinobacter excellens HL-55]|uniref:MSHA pilin protein MshD n=1 Tax=Marinobacter excellens HL-55 TaxID=1305731 RepID=A0A0P7YDC3_9GAMM|nr:MAG: MSHA pilin protein MshD [Marinobacter excellens HL-55]